MLDDALQYTVNVNRSVHQSVATRMYSRPPPALHTIYNNTNIII